MAMTLRHSLFSLVLLTLFFPPLTPARQTTPETAPVADIRINILAAPDPSLWTSKVRNLLPFKKGDPFSLALLEEAITALKDSRLFETIHVPDPEKTDAGMVLTFEVTPFSRIKDIRIRNAFPLFQREILNVMTMDTGSTFAPKTMEDQTLRIQQLFRQQGFPKTKAKVTAAKETKDGYYVVDVDIDKGPFQKIGRIRFQGNQAVSSLRLRLSAKIWRASLLPGTGGRFVPQKMKEDIKTLTALYRQKGFAQARITATAEENQDKTEVAVLFTVKEGPCHRIRFTGNQALSSRTLKKELTLKRDGNLNDFTLKRNLRNMKKKYAEKGFPQARLQTEAPALPEAAALPEPGLPGEPDKLRKILIQVDEGPGERVASLALLGNRHLPLTAIRENILTPDKGGIFNPDVLKEDAQAIQALYMKEGFPFAKVDPRVRFQEEGKTRWAVVELVIVEGPRVRVKAVSFSGLSALEREAALSLVSLKPGLAYDPSQLEADRAALHRAVSEAGYPHVQITVIPTFSRDEAWVDLAYHLQEGPLTRIGSIIYTGNLRTREEILAREMPLAPGDPFVLSKILDSRRKLMDLNAVDSARIRSVGLKTREQDVDLIVEVSEKKPYAVELGTGYDTERHLYVTAGAGDRNLLGLNLNLGSEAEVSQIGYKLDLSLTEPRFLALPISSHTRMFTEQREEFNKDYGIRTYGVSQDFLRTFWNKTLTLNLGAVYEFRDQYLTQPLTLTEDEASEFTTRHILVITPGLIFRTTDSFIRPTKGILATAGMDLSKGIDTSLDDFAKFKTDLRYYFPVFKSLTLALRAGYGQIIPYGGNSQFPDDQLFYLGGTSTIRGFSENMLRYDALGNSVGGLEMMMGSVETRIDLGRNVEASLFWDTGVLKRTQGQSQDESFRESAGLGLRYLTPVGPIGFLYGWKLDPKAGEARGSLHFSMGYTF